MKTSVVILFEQEVGHVDEEHQDTNGVRVVLSFWETPNRYKVPKHYILSTQVMVDRELVVNTEKLSEESGWQSHAKEIRKAIAKMDELINSHPNLNVLAGVKSQ
jgi:hypothetical protein